MVTENTMTEKENSAPTFEESLARLEEIVRQLESGELPLADGLDRYEEGVAHLRRCYQMIEHAERRIELLQRVEEDGTAQTEPFDEQQDATLSEKAEQRSKRRSARKSTSRGKEDSSNNTADDEKGDIDDGSRLF